MRNPRALATTATALFVVIIATIASTTAQVSNSAAPQRRSAAAQPSNRPQQDVPPGGGGAPIGTGGGRHHSFKGTISSVDSTAKSFTVYLAKGRDLVLKVNDKTKYSPKGRGWDDITADVRVTGTYRTDGTDNWAITIHLSTPRASAGTAKTGS